MRNFVITLFLMNLALISEAQTENVTPAESTCTARHENSLAEVQGKLVLVGGRGMRPVESWDPETGEWTSHPGPPLELNHFQAVSYKGELWVLGAFTGSFPHEIPVPDIYIFNLEHDEWRKGPSIPEDRRRGAAGAFVYKDNIYLIGGETDGHYEGFQPWFDKYDPSDKTWTRLPDAPHPRDHVSVAVVNDKLVVAGGRQSFYKENKVIDTTLPYVDIYDFTSGKWITAPDASNIPTERAGASAVAYGSEVFIIGGESGAQIPAHNEVEAFNPETNTWKSYPVLGQGRHGTGAVNSNGTIYIAGGSANRGGGPELCHLEGFTPED